MARTIGCGLWGLETALVTVEIDVAERLAARMFAKRNALISGRSSPRRMPCGSAARPSALVRN